MLRRAGVRRARTGPLATDRRQGFTLLEILVATAVVALLGALAVVTLSSYQSTERVRASYDILRDLNSRLHLYDSLTGSTLVGVRNAVIGRYPQMLSHLVNPIVNATSTSGNCLDCHSSCGLNQTGIAGISYGYSLTNKQAWDAKGPFYNRQINVSRGFPIPIGFVRDSLVRTPPQTSSTAVASSEAGTLQIQIDSVSTEDAMELKRMIDGQTTDATVGTIRWTGAPDAAGMRRIFWASRVRGC